MDISTPIIKSPFPKYSQGLGIIEIMVALVISSVLMAGVYIIFDSSKKTYILQQEMAELSDNARFIIDEFKSVIRESGYSGCQGTYTNPFVNSQNNQNIDGVPSNQFPQSDTLVINNFFQPLKVADPNLALTTPNIELDPNSMVPAQGNNTILISNCKVGPHVYTVPASSITPAATPWGRPQINVGSLQATGGYEPPYDIYIQQNLIYQVNASSGGQFWLAKSIDGGTTFSPFVEGVQNMQLRYGIDPNGDNIPDQYVQANNIANNNVISIRVTLLMRTLNRRGIKDPGNPINFQLDSGLPSPYDDGYAPHQESPQHAAREEGYRHRLFTTTIFVRNSIYPM